MSNNNNTLDTKSIVLKNNIATIKKLFDEGMSLDEISKRLEIPKVTITKVLKFDLCKKIELLFSQGYNSVQISKMIGLNRRTISEWVNNGDNQALYAFAKPKSTMNKQDLTNLVIKDYLKLIPVKTIAQLYKSSFETISNILKESGFNVLSSGKMRKMQYHIDGQYNKPFSNDLEDFLTGSLLGDGHMQIQIHSNEVPDYNYDLHGYQNALTFLTKLRKNSFIGDTIDFIELINRFNNASKIICDMPTSTFHLDKSYLESQWVEYITTFFINNEYKTKLNERTYVKKSGFTGDRITVTEIMLNSNASVQLEAIRKKWYDNRRKKHIPSDLKLTPDILLYWYIDDGNLANKNIVTLYTNDYTKDEVIMLSKKIYEATGITFYVKEKIRKGKIYPLLICSKYADSQAFFNYLEKSNSQSLLLAKKIFPWKFDPNIKKFDYLQSIRDTDPIVQKYLTVKDSNKTNNII